MLLDNRERSLFLVLTADREKNTSSGKPLKHLLKCTKALTQWVWRAEFQILRTVVSTDAAPQRVVQVADDNFPGLTERAAHNCFHLGCGLFVKILRIENLRHCEHARVERRTG